MPRSDIWHLRYVLRVQVKNVGVSTNMYLTTVITYRGQVLEGMSAVLLHILELFVSPARASRALAENAISWTSPVCRLAGLYERPAPARVHVRVRLP